MFLIYFIGECVAAILFPFILLSYAFRPSAYRLYPDDILRRAKEHFHEVPGYCEVVVDLMEDELLTIDEKQEACCLLEKDLIRAINYSVALEA